MSTQPSPVGFQFVVKFIWHRAVEKNAISKMAVTARNLEPMMKRKTIATGWKRLKDYEGYIKKELDRDANDFNKMEIIVRHKCTHLIFGGATRSENEAISPIAGHAATEPLKISPIPLSGGQAVPKSRMLARCTSRRNLPRQ